MMPLSEATKAVVLEALEFRKRKTLEFREFDPAMADEQVITIDAAITELQAAQAGEWRPVGDGFIADPNVASWWMHVTSCHITIGTKEGGYTYFLPDHIRLCEYIGSQEGHHGI